MATEVLTYIGDRWRSHSPMDLPDISSRSLVAIAGPQLLSASCNIFLLGILTVQVSLYHIAFQRDRFLVQTSIYGVYILELAQSLLLVKDIFKNFAQDFGNPAALNRVGLLWLSIPVLTGVVTFICQGLYAYRINILLRNKMIVSLVVLCCSIQLIAAVVVGAEAEQEGILSGLFTRKSSIFTGIWYCSAAICDVLIAISMTYYFFGVDPKIGRTRMSLQRIVRITVGTGSLTAAVAIVCCILSFLPSKPAYYQTSTAILGKLYSNSMLVLLNSRLSFSSSVFNSANTGENVDLETVRVGLSNLEFLDWESGTETDSGTATAVPDSASSEMSGCRTSSGSCTQNSR